MLYSALQCKAHNADFSGPVILDTVISMAYKYTLSKVFWVANSGWDDLVLDCMLLSKMLLFFVCLFVYTSHPVIWISAAW